MSEWVQAFHRINLSFDKWIMITILILIAAGLLMNLMATSNRLADTNSIGSQSYVKYKVDIYAKFRSHLMKVMVGIAFGIFCYLVPVERWRQFRIPLSIIVLSLILFVLVHFFGEEVNGARRWLRFKGFQISPSDVARFGLVLWMADFLARKKNQLHIMQNVLKALFVLAIIALPIILQPNLSTVMILAAIVGSMLWVSGIPRKWVYIAIGCVICLGSIYTLGTGFRHARSRVFIDPYAAVQNYEQNLAIDPTGANVMKETSYQQRQSVIAMVEGGLFGVGYGTGKQKYFLPEAYNDCIIAIIGEEWGALGIVVVLTLFGVLAWRGIRVTAYAPDQFQYLLAFGIVMNFLTYFFIHFFVNVSAMPSTGVPLPFISHGGTAMVFNLGLAAILLRISTEAKCPLYPK